MVCLEMMSSIEFMLASPQVRALFEEWKYMIELSLGLRLPDQVPYPEEAAAMTDAGQRGGPQAAAQERQMGGLDMMSPEAAALQEAGGMMGASPEGGGNGAGIRR